MNCSPFLHFCKLFSLYNKQLDQLNKDVTVTLEEIVQNLGLLDSTSIRVSENLCTFLQGWKSNTVSI